MDEVFEQDHSMTNDDLKGSSTRSSKPSSQTSRSRRDKRRRRRTNSEHSSSSSRSSSSSSNHSSQSSNIEQHNQQDSSSTNKKSRSTLAQEYLQTIIDKSQTGHYEIIDNFAFLTFESDDDWRRAFEHCRQQESYPKSFSTRKSSSISTRKNGHSQEHSDGHNSNLHRSISAPCKSEDGQRNHSTPNSAPVEETMTDNHRSSIWPKNTHDLSSNKTIKSEPMEKTSRSNRNPSEHDEHPCNTHEQSPPSSSQKSTDDSKSETQEKKHHHHHHHKSHKKHKSKHDLSINGDSSTKHPTITSMSDLAKQHIKHQSMSMPTPFPYPSHFDSKLFPLPHYPPFPSPSTSHPNPYDPSLMLAGRFYPGAYPRDLPMPPPPPPSAGSTGPSSNRLLSNVDGPASMEKLLEKFYPGVLPSYLATSPVTSLNMKYPGASSNGAEHSLWPPRDPYQRSYLPGSTTKINPTTKMPHHPSPSPTDRQHHSSNPNPPPTQAPPLYIAPVIVTEFHQHQHNHNHTHEHKLNITTKDDRPLSTSSSSPRSKTPSSNENKKQKSSFSVNDMFIDKSSSSTSMKHSPSPSSHPSAAQQQQQQPQGFLSVMNKKESQHPTTNTHLPLKKTFNGKWSTAHIHIARMISQHERNQREKLNAASKLRSTSALLPPPMPLLDTPNDLGLLRPPMPSPFGLPLDMNLAPYPMFRPPLSSVPSSPSSSSSTSALKFPRPTTVTPSSIKTPSLKRDQKTPFTDDRLRRPSPPPPPSPALSRSTSNSNFPPSSPSQRMRMDFPSLLLPPSQHQLPNFSLPDDRKRFLPGNPDHFPSNPFAPPPHPSTSSPFLFPMGAPSLTPLPPSPSSRRNLHLGNSDPSKASLFPPPPTGASSMNPFDFTRTSLLPGGLPLPNPTFESDRYRLFFEHQAREREFQMAMMAAATSNGPAPPPSSLFPDSNPSALFKHY